MTPAGVELWPAGSRTATPVGAARLALGELFAARFSKGKMDIERAPSVSLHAALDILEMLKTVQFETRAGDFTETVLRALPSRQARAEADARLAGLGFDERMDAIYGKGKWAEY